LSRRAPGGRRVAAWDEAPFSAPAAELLRAAASAQPPQPANVVVLLQERRYEFDAAGRATLSMRLVYRVDSQAGVEGWSSIGEYWQPWHEQRPEVRARVVTPDGVQHDLDPKYLKDTPARNDEPLIYQDSRVTQGPLPAVAVGAVVERETHRVDTQPFFAAGVVRELALGARVPILETRVTIDAPASLPMRRVLREVPGAVTSETRSGDRVRYTLTLGVLDKIPALPPALPYDAVIWPQLGFATGESWAAVARAYSALTEPVLAGADVSVLTHGIDASRPREERVRELVARLHKAVRYTGIEFGVSQIVPRSPAETLSNGFGDCKDKSSVLVAALRASGIPASLVLLRAGPGREVDPQLPGLGTFNHAIVYAPGTPDLWIDATAEYTPVGNLPSADRGRLALPVDVATDQLVRTPATTPEQQLVVERREFFLPELGKARVIETTEPAGDAEGGYRAAYASPATEERRKKIEEYATQTYVAERLASYEATRSDDFSKPFSLRLEIEGSRNAVVETDSASMIISIRRLADRLPEFLREAPKTGPLGTPDQDLRARGVDVVIAPFGTEWRYHVVLPPGYRVASLPATSVTPLGPASYSQSFMSEPDGSVTAVLRFESGSGRYSPAAALELAREVAALIAAPSPTLHFETEAQHLAAASNIAAALRSAGELAALHPKEALHRVQIARILLNAGLAEHAQAVAREATVLEPQSALAWSTLGWALEHDAIGRPFGAGFDLEGALVARRKAVALEPKDTEWIGDLAFLCEMDAQGVRYSPRAHLDEAIAAYRTRAKLIEHDDEDGVMYLATVLFRTERFAELREELPHPSGDAAHGLVLAAITAQSGAKNALAAANSLGKSGAALARILEAAANNLVPVRRYPEAAELIEAAARLVPGSSEMLSRAELLRATHRAGSDLLPADDPRRPIFGFLEAMLGLHPNVKPTEWISSTIYEALPESERREAVRQLTGGLGMLKDLVDAPRDVVNDLIQSNLKISLDGRPEIGQRAQLSMPGMASMRMYVQRESRGWRVVGTADEGSALGLVALERLDRGDVAAARQWLDWAREDLHVSGGDDPLAVPPFARLWRKGQAADEATVRIAATVLAIPMLPKGRAVAVLAPAAAALGADTERGRYLRAALAAAAVVDADWTRLLTVGRELLAALPDSETALVLVQGGLHGTSRYDELEALVQERLRRMPDDEMSLLTLAEIRDAQGRDGDAQGVLKPILDSGRSTATENNQYAWYGLVNSRLTKSELDAAQAAIALDGGKQSATLHTLACIYGAMGRNKDARDMLEKVMQQAQLTEPDSRIWFGLAVTAEADGDLESARRDFARVERGKEPLLTPSSMYSIAQARLKALGPPSKW
jgi:transglutaminase-like putative cysteine protease/tetratricopeptide (TPR) repeat protein